MQNIFGENIFDKNICAENIFGNNIFFGKGFDFPSLLFTPNIQLTSYLKLRGGRNKRNKLTDRTHTHIVSFIILDESTARYLVWTWTIHTLSARGEVMGGM